METFKKIEIWKTAIGFYVGITLGRWLFGKGWIAIKGGMSFAESFEGFEFQPHWLVIALAISFSIHRRKVEKR